VSDHISLTIPRNDAAALRSAAKMLNELADSLDIYDEILGETTDPDAFAEEPFRPKVAPLTKEDFQEAERVAAFVLAGVKRPDTQPEETGAETINEPSPLNQAHTIKDYVDSQIQESLEAPPTGVELDKEGLPWDMRVDAGTKTKNKDGTWKAKKGVDKEYRKQVKEELRKLMAIEPAVDQTLIPESLEAPITDQVETLIDSGVTPQAAVAAASTVVPPPPVEKNPSLIETHLSAEQTDHDVVSVPPPPVEPTTVAAGTLTYGGVSSAPSTPPVVPASDSPTDYPGFLKAAAVLIQEKRTDLVAINTLLNNKGIGGVNGLAQRPDLIPGVWAELQTVLK